MPRLVIYSDTTETSYGTNTSIIWWRHPGRIAEKLRALSSLLGSLIVRKRLCEMNDTAANVTGRAYLASRFRTSMGDLEIRYVASTVIGGRSYHPSYRESNRNYVDLPTTPWVISVLWRRLIIQG